MSGPPSRREQLGRELEHLRKLAGLSGRALAGMLPISQSTISRAESGKTLLSRDEVSAWTDATSADTETRTQEREPLVSANRWQGPATVVGREQ